MLFFLAIFIVHFTTPSSSQSYPIFGTKRYHRSPSAAQMPVPASLVPNPSYYSSSPNHYYEQRSAYAYPTYHETYPDDNPYYYYPRQEYYGMPIYHGEYKPTPYYYAHPPNYSYFDDREISNNPMDDLHEEILHEDERERQRDLVPAEQEDWYDGEGVQQQEELTNNFLRNLIAYNRQISAQEQEQEQQQQHEEQSVMDHNEPKQRPQDYQNDRVSPMYEEEYVDYPSSEYENVPEQPTSYNVEKLTKLERQGQDRHSVVEDENERQLKYLAQHQIVRPHMNKPDSHHANHWSQPEISKNSEKTKNMVSFNEEETGPEYEDDTWINWDRKRSSNTEMKMFPQPSNDESIKAFSNRKLASPLGRVSTTAKSFSTETVPTTRLHIQAPSSTPMTTHQPKHSAPHTGQKEVVLPRPAGSFPRSLFSKTLQGAAQTDSNMVPDAAEKLQQDAKSNVYDTIKHLIAMRQQYQQNASKLQKRFVSNEESLVHELDSLKRRSA